MYRLVGDGSMHRRSHLAWLASGRRKWAMWTIYSVSYEVCSDNRCNDLFLLIRETRWPADLRHPGRHRGCSPVCATEVHKKCHMPEIRPLLWQVCQIVASISQPDHVHFWNWSFLWIRTKWWFQKYVKFHLRRDGIPIMSLTVAKLATAISLHEDDRTERNLGKQSNQMRGAGSRHSSWFYCSRKTCVALQMVSDGTPADNDHLSRDGDFWR
jgi:hypothetical protein